ncbi:hypothetical protein E4U52_002143 [Claviceps spartinae]|nr:hypothetical protein E4U52_002143 [Claviceps spartinae]
MTTCGVLTSSGSVSNGDGKLADKLFLSEPHYRNPYGPILPGSFSRPPPNPHAVIMS